MAGATWRARNPRSGSTRSRGELSLAVQTREALWLQQVREGKATKEIAQSEGLSRRRIQQGISRAALRERDSRLSNSHIQDYTSRILQGRGSGNNPVNGTPRTGRYHVEDPRCPPRLVPLFPIGPFTPQSICPHHGPIRPGSIFCCMVCSQSGMDEHPALKRDPCNDPRPEPRTCMPAEPGAGRQETRKERRRRMHEARRAAVQLAGRI
jgi:hypothetical protein